MKLRIEPNQGGFVVQLSSAVKSGKTPRQTVGNMTKDLEDARNFLSEAIADMGECLVDGKASDLLEGYTYRRF